MVVSCQERQRSGGEMGLEQDDSHTFTYLFDCIIRIRQVIAVIDWLGPGEAPKMG